MVGRSGMDELEVKNWHSGRVPSQPSAALAQTLLKIF
jgi:hypothetical protein